jgi:hypothetical protein
MHPTSSSRYQPTERGQQEKRERNRSQTEIGAGGVVVLLFAEGRSSSRSGTLG